MCIKCCKKKFFIDLPGARGFIPVDILLTKEKDLAKISIYFLAVEMRKRKPLWPFVEELQLKKNRFSNL